MSSFSPFYLSALAWNLANGMANVLVPLYALVLGMSGFEIGSLLALPVFLQFFFNLAGGAFVDRLGAKNILYASSIAVFLSAVMFVLSEVYWGLLFGMCLNVLTRASFWPASYALCSELPGERSTNMGRLNSVTSAGQICGTAAAGLLIGLVGYKSTFWVAALDGLILFLLIVPIRETHRPRTGPAQSAVETYKTLARLKPMYFGMACAALSVLPFTTGASFGAILLVSEGYTSGETGWLLTLRALGALFAGAVVARYVRSAFDRRVAIVACAGMAAATSLMAASPSAWLIGSALFLLGTSSGVISVYFQLLVSAVSSTVQRGSAMSYGGLGWNFSSLFVPLLMGFLMDHTGIHAAFHILGALLLVCAAAFVPFYRWAFKSIQRDQVESGARR